jgi:hypothetical protein
MVIFAWSGQWYVTFVVRSAAELGVRYLYAMMHLSTEKRDRPAYEGNRITGLLV